MHGIVEKYLGLIEGHTYLAGGLPDRLKPYGPALPY